IHLENNRKNRILLSSRLNNILIERGCRHYADYIRLLSRHRPEDIREFVTAMCTKTTQFFRESPHFDLLAQLIRQRRSPQTGGLASDLRLWCAATSTGQEAY